MKTTIKFVASLVFCIGLTVGCGKKQQHVFSSLKDSATVAQLKSFAAEKEAQAKASAEAHGQTMPPELQKYFDAAKRGDWLAVSNQFNNFVNPNSGQTSPQMRGMPWEPMIREAWGALYFFGAGDEKYSAAFGNDIIKSIPPGSIYFGGTDPGRFVITAMQKSQVNGDPFFTLTQNALADGTYLDYLRSMYGDKIKIPTPEDSQKCFQDYTEDAQRRMQNHQLKPGENVRQDSNGHIQVSGQVAVMEINGLLVKTIFDKNPDREFYIEESFPLDWMYPYLEPHGLIMKINRQQLPELSGEIVQRDSDYWTKYLTPMIGGWLDKDTPVKEVATFAEKVFVKKDLSGFTGDPQFVQNEYSCKMFSKLRSSQAGLYAWRAQHTADAAEKERMTDAADFAFRQAWALCPYSPETVLRYADLLMSQSRRADALLVAETAAKMPENRGNDQLSVLVTGLGKSQNQ